MKGNEDRAINYYLRIHSSTQERLFDTHRREQYFSTHMIAGKDVPIHGEIKNDGLHVAQVAVQLLLS